MESKLEIHFKNLRTPNKVETAIIVANQWVMDNYSSLYILVGKILVNGSGAAISGSYNEEKKQIWLNSRERPGISTPGFISTLVHELTHAKQHKENRFEPTTKLGVNPKTNKKYTEDDYRNHPLEVEARKAGDEAWKKFVTTTSTYFSKKW